MGMRQASGAYGKGVFHSTTIDLTSWGYSEGGDDAGTTHSGTNGVKTSMVGLVGVYSDPERDPRGHFVTAAYHLKPMGGSLKAGDDAADAEWVPLDRLPKFAFDHGKIVKEFIAGRR